MAIGVRSHRQLAEDYNELLERVADLEQRALDALALKERAEGDRAKAREEVARLRAANLTLRNVVRGGPIHAALKRVKERVISQAKIIADGKAIVEGLSAELVDELDVIRGLRLQLERAEAVAVELRAKVAEQARTIESMTAEREQKSSN